MKRMRWDDQMRDLKLIDQDHVLSGDGWRGWDGMIRWEINWPRSRTNWRRMKRMGWDDQMRDLKLIDQVHVPTGDGWDDQMRDLKPIDQVHVLSGNGWRGWDGMIRWQILNQLIKIMYKLETDEVDGDNQMRDLKSNDKVHVLPGDGWRGWDASVMIRWEILNQ